MVVGVVGLLLSLMFWSSWGGVRHRLRPPPHDHDVDEDPTPPGV